MKPTRWLRSLAVLLALFAIGHTLGTASPTVTRGAAEAAVFGAMQGFRFPIMGFERTHWDFYRGFAISVSVLQAGVAVMAWQLAALAKVAPRLARPLARSLLLVCVGLLVVSEQFFFGLPIAMSAVAVAIAAMAVASLERASSR